MFQLELISPQKLESATKSEEGFEYNCIDVPEMKLWKLISTISGDLTWDFPVLHPSRTNVVFILAIPSFMSYLDICKYIKGITQIPFKITFLNCLYRSAVIEFSTQEGADSFYIYSIGEPFNIKFEHIRCISLFLLEVTPNIGIQSIPTNEDCCQRELTLPLCPLCFQLFDPSINSFFSLSTVNDFSEEAYLDWGESKCPVCSLIFGSKHMQQNHPNNDVKKTTNDEGDDLITFYSHSNPTSLSDDHLNVNEKLKCQTPGCEETEKLWICMECGHVGCGREKNQHSLQHFFNTKHRFSLRFVNLWLWDYIADKAVTRLFQDKFPEANNDVLRQYRTKLFSNITAVRMNYEEDIKQIVKSSQDEIDNLTKELKMLEEEEQSLNPKYQEIVELDQKIKEIKIGIDKLQKDPMMEKSNKLQNANKLLKKQSKEKQARINELYNFLEKRPDFSNDVDISIQ